jgi:uncharacterized sulfatase
VAQDVKPNRPNILFCIADDLSWHSLGAYGERAIQTPAFDRVAREGVLFRHAFCNSPSCSPSRAAILTGQDFWRLEEGANLWSTLPAKFKTYPDLLEAAGYAIGQQGKGWGPGNDLAGGRTRPPAGPRFKDLDTFLKTVPAGQPFCYWFGSQDPHRPYPDGAGDVDPRQVTVPPYLPDHPTVRADIADYLFEVRRFDQSVGAMLQNLEQRGLLDDTIVVITSDNGMPFPRAKTNLYDSGTRMPLAIRYPKSVPAGRVINDFVNLTDMAPTFLEAAGLPIAPDITARSLWSVLTGGKSGIVDATRDSTVVGRERHTSGREGDVGYPMRALRTRDYLYIRNFAPERWPAGDPEIFSDIDGGAAKNLLREKRGEEPFKRFWDLAAAKRPAEELYDLKRDPDQLNNIAAAPVYAAIKARLSGELLAYLKKTNDPRVIGGEKFDTYQYYGKKQDFQKY